MITRAKIDDWIRQVEATPVLAPILIRQITDRLLEMDALNESLRAENLELSTGNTVKLYETRIAELEFKLDLLTRQIGKNEGSYLLDLPNLILYNDQGQVLRFEIEGYDSSAVNGQPITQIKGLSLIRSYNYGLVVVSPYDQLLLVFNTGRTTTLSVDQIPIISTVDLDWESAYRVDLRTLEELSSLIPITRLHVYDQCAQTSRFGYARKVSIQYLNTFISNNNIGKGVKFNFDRILNLILCKDDQTLVLVSHTGIFLGLEVSALPVSLGEVLRLKVKDYLVSAFLLDSEKKIVAVSQNGKIFTQNSSWLAPTKSGERKSRQLSAKNEQDGLLAGAVMVGAKDWIAIYREDGTLSIIEPEQWSTPKTSSTNENMAKVLAVAGYSPFQSKDQGA